jgi:hypothetical protein
MGDQKTQYMTVSEAARHFNVPEGTISSYCTTGRFNTIRRVDMVRLVLVSDVEEYMKTRRPVNANPNARPKKKRGPRRKPGDANFKSEYRADNATSPMLSRYPNLDEDISEIEDHETINPTEIGIDLPTGRR